jgi:hypothetical protein
MHALGFVAPSSFGRSLFSERRRACPFVSAPRSLPWPVPSIPYSV